MCGQAANHYIFIHEDGSWVVKGNFEAAVEDDDNVSWIMQKGEHVLNVLLVSFFLIVL